MHYPSRPSFSTFKLECSHPTTQPFACSVIRVDTTERGKHLKNHISYVTECKLWRSHSAAGLYQWCFIQHMSSVSSVQKLLILMITNSSWRIKTSWSYSIESWEQKQWSVLYFRPHNISEFVFEINFTIFGILLPKNCNLHKQMVRRFDPINDLCYNTLTNASWDTLIARRSHSPTISSILCLMANTNQPRCLYEQHDGSVHLCSVKIFSKDFFGVDIFIL